MTTLLVLAAAVHIVSRAPRLSPALVHESCGLRGPDRDSRSSCAAATLKG